MERFNFEEECRLIMRFVIENKFPTITSIETHKKNYCFDANEAYTDFDAIREEACNNFQCLYSFDTVQENGEKNMDEEYFTKMLYDNFPLLYDTMKEINTHPRTTLSTSIYPLICAMFKYVCYNHIFDYDIEVIFDDVLEEYNKGFVQYHLSVPTKGYRNVIIEVPSGWSEEKLRECVQDGHYDKYIVDSEIDIDSLEDYNGEIKIEKI